MFLKLGLESVETERAAEVAEAVIDRIFSGCADEDLPVDVALHYPLLQTLSDAVRSGLERNRDAIMAEPAYLEALEEGIALGFAVVAELAEVEAMPLTYDY